MPRKSTKKLPALLLFTALVSVPTTGCVAHPPHRTAVTYEVHKAPPAPRREAVVARPGRGHAWVAGHYVWRPASKKYVWVAGKWVKPPRRGAVWVAPKYEKRRGRVIFVAGYWR